MSPIPIQYDAAHVSLAARLFSSVTVAASPSAATETTICTVTVTGDIAATGPALLFGFAAFTVGTSGTACRLRIRQTDTSGATKGDTGATTGGISAGNLVGMYVQGQDAAPTLPGQVYVLTLTVTGGAAASTVSNASLIVLVP